MGSRHGPSRRTLLMGAVVAGLILALAVPAIALGALNPASFYSYRPGSGSSTTNTRPLISVTGYDGYGVQGSTAYSATLDGISVRPRITYYTGYGYKKFTLSYTPTTALSSGKHKFGVSIKDGAGRRYGTSWSFTVQGDTTAPVTTASTANYPGIALVTLTATDSGSGVAHTYYRLDGAAQKEGTLVVVDMTGIHSLEFWSVDKAGNTEAPKTSSVTIVGSHATPDLDCTTGDCHVTDLATIHLAKGCAMCHANGETPQSNCHDCHGTDFDAIHPNIEGAHTAAAINCTASDCHGTEVRTIHGEPDGPGCAACHAAGVTASVVCADCHSTDLNTVHAAGNAQHFTTAPDTQCFDALCHASNDVSVIHTKGDDPPGCDACHAEGVETTVVCAECHVTPPAAEHQNFPHVDATGTKSSACVACHGTDLPTAHDGVFTGQPNLGCFCHTSSTGIPMAGLMGPLLAAGEAECLDCHKDPHEAHSFEMKVSGHNTTTYGSPGAKSKFDGSQGALLKWESEMTTTIVGKAAGNNGTYTVGQVATMTTTWDFPTKNVFWASNDASAPAHAIKGLTKDSVITCQDCHTGLNAGGPHGAAQNWGLDPNYPGDYSYAELTKYVVTNNAYSSATATGGVLILDPARYSTPLSVSGIAMFPGAAAHSMITSTSVASTASVPGWVPGVTALGNRTDGTDGPTAVICAKCHDLENYYPGGTTGTGTPTVEGSNTAHDSHHQDQLDGSAQCVNCHVGIPHGWKSPRLLVNTDVDAAPYFDPQAIGTTRATSTGMQTGDTRLPAGVFGAGFNRQGMQALSGVNNHTLGLADGTQPYSTGDGTATTTLNLAHFGMAYWDESQCQACGDHEGENAPAKIITTD